MSNKESLVRERAKAIKPYRCKNLIAVTEDCLKHLERYRYVSIATSPHIKGKKTVILHEGDYTHKRIAVWFGNEARGVSDLAIERSEFCVTIPMFGMIESLNLGTTSGIVLYEITKQRREYQEKYKRAIHGPKGRGTRSQRVLA